MIFANFVDSLWMNSRYCSGVLGAGSKPIFLGPFGHSGPFHSGRTSATR
jgi:hypothetical protein